MQNQQEEILAFWNDRANEGDNAGTNDWLLRDLEIKQCLDRVPDRARVLDIGSGNGMTLCRLAKDKQCHGIGIDYADKLVSLANEQAKNEGLADRIQFQQGEIPGLAPDLGAFDVVMTQRCLINLLATDTQLAAFNELKAYVKSGGLYLMFENSHQGLAAINRLRKQLGLELMQAPWHNHYFDEETITSWQSDDFKINELCHFSSTYHFVSRVIYAKYAADRGETCVYESALNKISCELPPFGEFGATKLWVWQKQSI